jgi:hypothetical protein
MNARDALAERAAMAPTPKPRTRLRAVRRDDHAAVKALFERHQWPVRSAAGWEWALFDNPAREAADADAGWVLEHGDGVVGFLGNLPVLCRHDGAPVWGATCTAYLVDDAHRAHSTRLMRAFAAQPGAAFLYSATANAHSAPVYKGFHFQRATQPQAHQRLRWLAHESAAARALSERRGCPGLGPLAKALGTAWGAVRQSLRRATAHDGCVVERLRAADLALPRDSHWQATWNAWARALWSRPGLWVDRSAATFAWRMGDPDLASDLHLWAVRDAQGRMQGMCMARELHPLGDGAPRAELMDWALLSHAPRNAAVTLLNTVITWARSRQLAFVDAKRWTGMPAEQLAALSPRVESLPDDGVWMLINRTPGLPELPEWPRWGMTGADSDDWFYTHRLTVDGNPAPWVNPAAPLGVYRRVSVAETGSAANRAVTSSPTDSTSAGSNRHMSAV